MSKSYPPSPIVEEEVDSLAREHGTDHSDSDISEGIPPADIRGAVDQYPLIIDVHEKSDVTPAKDTFTEKQKTKSQGPPPVSQKPNTSSRTSRDDHRFVPNTRPANTPLEIPQGQPRPRSKSTIGIAPDEGPRGRANVSRLNTDLGADVHSMATGQRRAPSPYSYRAASSTLLPSLLDDKSKVSLLSPESAAALPKSSDSTRRARSQRRDIAYHEAETSDSDDKRSSYRRHRSPSGVDRASFSRHSGGEMSSRGERPPYSSRRSERNPPRDKPSTTSHRSAHGNITPPQTPGFSKESPYASAAEDSDRRRHERRRFERRYSKESPYTSAAEDRSSRLQPEARDGTRSRRQSVHRSQKPHIDLSDQQSRSHIHNSQHLSAHTPNAFDRDLEQAFRDNQKKSARSYHRDGAGVSPFTSPPTSPPRTPRGERKSRDYFEMNAPTANVSKQRSRPPSLSENPIKPMTTLLSAATMGAATLAAKSIPNMSRSSTASLETPSSGSQGSIASGQRSRKPSPVYEPPRSPSRSEMRGREEVQTARATTLPVHSDRPPSRAGSVNSQDGNPPRPNTYPGLDARPPSRNGIPMTYGLVPPPTQRSSSFNTASEQAHLRPSVPRTYSTTGGSASSVRAGNQNRLPHSHLSQPFYPGSDFTSSPMSSRSGDHMVFETPGLQHRESSTPPNSQEKTANVTFAAEPSKKPISLPLCPRPYAVYGASGWHSISGLSNLEVCVSCMHVLGDSPLREYCYPSPRKPADEAVTCALSRPWIRIVVARCLKEGKPDIGLLQSLSTMPPDMLDCPGRQSDIRRWYHVQDPSTRTPVQGFNVCTACVRSVELVFPSLLREKIFHRPENKPPAERYCNLHPGSKHFYSIIDRLDKLAKWCKRKQLRTEDISDFGEFVRQKARYRECARDAMLATQLWHFMPALPEFTICEECYEEVVWPLNERPIARDVVMTLQKVPIARPAHYVAGISCQLYSDRMRKVFKDAVNRGDFEALRSAALTRYNVEHRLQEKQRQFDVDLRNGMDVRADMERNISAWKQYE